MEAQRPSPGARASRPPIAGDHYRGYLPHWERGETPQAITFRLADSLPRALLDGWAAELAAMPLEARQEERRRRIAAALDAGHGACWLARPDIAAVVETALLNFEGRRYRLHCWCVMPNHVHVLVTLLDGHTLSAVLHAWKSFTAKRINAILGRQGVVWQPEYFDRVIRNQSHFDGALYYIEQNPVKAGFCASPQDWPYSSAR